LLQLEPKLESKCPTKVQRLLWDGPRPRTRDYPTDKVWTKVVGDLPKYKRMSSKFFRARA
jgi:hypothetical protein